MYDVHRLRLLRELSHRGTLAAVAEALGFSPSSVSHQLTQLEREVGARLLEPVGRGVRLTTAAHTLVAHTEAILRELEEAEADVAASRARVSGTVRIGSFQTAAHGLLLDVVDTLTDRYPDLEASFTHVDAAEALPALVARDFDLVLSEHYPGDAPPAHRGVRTEQIADDPLLLATPTGWTAKTLADLAEAPWVMELPGTTVRRWTTAQCRAAGFEPHVVFESADVTWHARLVARGRAAAYLPRMGVEPTGDVRLMATGRSRAIMLSRRSGSERNPAVAAVRSAFVDAAPVSTPPT